MTTLQDQIDEAVKSAVDKIVPTIPQISSLILPTVTEDDASGQHQHSQATSQYIAICGTLACPVPPSGYGMNINRPVNSSALMDMGPSNTSQPSGGMQETFSNQPLPVRSPLHKHTADLTGKEEDSDSSQEELDSFSFTLTSEEVEKVGEQEFLDFSVIYKRHLAVPLWPGRGGLPLIRVSVKDWARIFMAFQAENARWHPKESTALPAYGDLILKMERAGMQWAKYDVIFRHKRAKQIIRRPKKVKNWSVTDIELYLCCDAPREPSHKPQPYKRTHTSSTQQTSTEGSQFKAGTCWKFQSFEGVRGVLSLAKHPQQLLLWGTILYQDLPHVFLHYHQPSSSHPSKA